jgi:hypothetical protein
MDILYKIKIVCLQLENGYTNLYQTSYIYVVRTEGDFRYIRKTKIVLSSSPYKGGSCSSETKHDRRTVPIPSCKEITWA